MPELLEAPPSTSDYNPMDANSIFASKENADNPAVQEALQRNSTQQTTQEANPEAKTSDGPTEVDKPDAMKDKPKGPASKIGKLSSPKQEKAPETQPAEQKTEEVPVDTSNAKQLREAYAKQKQDMANLRAELDKLRPDAQKVAELRTELQSSQEELAKLKAMNLSDEERTRFDGLRQQHALYELKQSKDYQEKIMAPIQARIGKIERAIQFSKLEPAGAAALKDAMDIEDEFQRDKEIRRIFSEVEMAPEDMQTMVSSMSAVGRELNEQLYPALEKAERQALEIEQASRAKQKQESEQATQREQQEYSKEFERLHKETSEEALKPLFDDTDLNIDGVTLAEALKDVQPAGDSADKALHAYSSVILPFAIAYANKGWEKFYELEAAQKLRNGSSPKMTDGGTKPVDDAAKGPSIEEAFGKGRRF